MTNILKTSTYSCRVSSVLQKSVKEYGKQFLFDDRDDTCWSSDQGTPQFIHLSFTEPIAFEEVRIQFQGGFAAKSGKIVWKVRDSDEERIEEFFPEDSNKVQVFRLKEAKACDVTRINLVFNESFDFYGRITIYQLEIV